MKSTAAFAAILAAGAMAQPHHARHAHKQAHAQKRELVVEWVTEYEYVTVTASDAIFMTVSEEESTSTTSTSTSTSTSEESTSTSTSEESTSTSSEETETTSSTPEPETTAEPTTSKEPKPKTTKSPEKDKPEPTTESAPASSSPPEEDEGSSGGSGGGFTPDYSGFITYYDIGLGACGWDDGGRAPTGSIDDPMVVAISYDVYFASLANPNKNPLCGKTIEMESPDNPGVIAYGKISDACRACTTAGDLDVNIRGMQNFYPGGGAVQKGKGSINWRIMD